jgi:hypothetical protein
LTSPNPARCNRRLSELQVKDADYSRAVLALLLSLAAEGEAVARIDGKNEEEVGQWRARPPIANRQIVPLSAVKLDGNGKETSETLDSDGLREALTQSRRSTLEAPGGGKTTTLVHLAAETRQGEVLFPIDLPMWVRSRTDMLEFIARSPPFRSRSVSAQNLARLAERQHFSFLLNGWNEISERYSEDAIIALVELERTFPAAGIMVATRTHYVSPPLPGAIRTKLLPGRRVKPDVTLLAVALVPEQPRLRVAGTALQVQALAIVEHAGLGVGNLHRRQSVRRFVHEILVCEARFGTRT